MMFNLKLVREYDAKIYKEGSSFTKLMRSTSKAMLIPSRALYCFLFVPFIVFFWLYITSQIYLILFVYVLWEHHCVIILLLLFSMFNLLSTRLHIWKTLVFISSMYAQVNTLIFILVYLLDNVIVTEFLWTWNKLYLIGSIFYILLFFLFCYAFHIFPCPDF